MTKKNGTINKIRNSKVFWAIASLLASFLLWAYMTSTEETTIDRTFYNVPVVFQGAEELRSSRGLIITEASVLAGQRRSKRRVDHQQIARNHRLFGGAGERKDR